MPKTVLYFFFGLCWSLILLFPISAEAENTVTSLPSDRLSPQKTKLSVKLAEGQADIGVESLLVGLYINTRLQAEDTVYRQRDEYWIPFSLFLEKTGLREERRVGGVARYQTNLGVISFDTASLKVFDSNPCISFTDLKKVFLTAPEFSPSLFAIILTIPWSSRLADKSAVAPTPDIKAPTSSLSIIGIEAQSAYDFNGNFNKNMLLETSGRLLGGVWSVTAEGDPAKSISPSRYQWTTYNKNLAFRLGTGYSGNYSLMNPSAFTGVQFGWNNRSILKQLDAEQNTYSDVFLNLDATQLKTIEGSGPPASIAELRFDGEAVARKRILLDGKFVFDNVRMTADLRKTEVYIYEHSINEKPIKVIDYSQSAASRALPGGELLVRGGAGQTGNPLLRQSGQVNSALTFVNALYGLNDRITVETSIQQNSSFASPDMLAGTILSVGSNWTAAVYGARSNNSYGSDVRIEGRYKYWNTAYWGTMRDEHFGAVDSKKEINHSFRWTANPFRNLSLQLIGRHEKQADVLKRNFLLPAGNWYPFSSFYLSVLPNEDQKYRYESGLRLGDQTTIHSTYTNNLATVDLLHTLTEHFNVRALNDHNVHTGQNVANLALNWYPRHNSNDLVEAAISRAGNNYGISGSWTRYINSGLRIALQYMYNMNNATNLNVVNIFPTGTMPQIQKSIALSLSWDLGLSDRRFFPVNRNAVTITRGSIAGSLDVEAGTKLSSADINNISILLNGRARQQRQIDGSFFIGSLTPGIYTLSVDPDNLPIELVVDQKDRTVEVKNGAVTGVKIPVYTVFGVAGMVKDRAEAGVADVMLTVTGRDGKVIARPRTNEFGYYRIDGLRVGQYVITPESVGGKQLPNSSQRTFSIKDDYLFDINLTIDNQQVPVLDQQPEKRETVPGN